MRSIAILATVLLLAACAFARPGLIRQGVARLKPDCDVDADSNFHWVEIEPWLYKVKACGAFVWCRERPGDGIKCSAKELLTKGETERRWAAELLRCPLEQVEKADWIDPPMGDPLKDHWWWGADEVAGCGRAVWCGDREIPRGAERTLLCEQPDDYGTVAAQLTVDTGCPVDQMVPQARQVFVKRFWKPPERGQQSPTITGQASWRIDACGHLYSCTVTGGAAAAVTCKTALNTGQQPDQGPPPPPPAQP